MKTDQETVQGVESSDESCMRALSRRQPEGLQPLFSRYAPLVFHIASESLGPAAAEDIVQDIFLTVWRKAETFDPRRGAFRPWLMQITHHRILNELRTRFVPDLASLPQISVQLTPLKLYEALNDSCIGAAA